MRFRSCARSWPISMTICARGCDERAARSEARGARPRANRSGPTPNRWPTGSAQGGPMNETERDPRVDAAWRAANRDEPPAALDDAIRAAARRAVEAGPQRKRDKHWWYPFAAAAT